MQRRWIVRKCADRRFVNGRHYSENVHDEVASFVSAGGWLDYLNKNNNYSLPFPQGARFKMPQYLNKLT